VRAVLQVYGYMKSNIHEKPSLNGQERYVSSLRDFKGDGIFPCSIIGIMEEVRNSFYDNTLFIAFAKISAKYLQASKFQMRIWHHLMNS
jgi:hypothetical protein